MVYSDPIIQNGYCKVDLDMKKVSLDFPHFLHFYAFDISTAYKKVDWENIKVLALKCTFEAA